MFFDALLVMSELKNRGIQDTLIAVVDGLQGFPEAIESVYPQAQVQTGIAQAWRRNWEQVIPFFAFAPAVRKIIYTTNAIESLHSQVRKAVRSHGHFPSDKAACKLIYLVLQQVEAKWTRPPIAWQQAKAQSATHFEQRFVVTG